MADGILFGGTFTRRPSVLAKVDDSGLNAFQIGSPRVVAIVGIGSGGQPKVPVLYSTPQDVRRAIRGGDLLEAALRAFTPSSQERGASQVYLVRVNPALQSALTLKDVAAANSVDLLSANYGVKDNQIKVKVETGTTQGKKLSVAYLSDLFVVDNVYRAAFQIQYVGAGSAATMTINGTTLTTAVTGGPGGEALSITLSNFPTIQALVDFIATKPAYTVSVLTLDPNQVTVNGLDFVSIQDIRTAAYTETATLAAVVDWFNSGQQPYVTALRSTGAGLPPVNIGYTYLAGGSEGTTINSDYQAAIDALQSKDVAFVVPTSSDAAIHAMVKVHCESLSANGKRPRRAVVGGALGEKTSTLQNYLTRATNLNSDRVLLIAQGLKDTDQNGVVSLLPPYIVAAGIAGLQAGVLEIGDPITFKSISCQGLEWDPTGADEEILLAGGVCPLELVEARGFFRVVRGISTWRVNDNFAHVEFSTGMALDQVVRDVVEGLEVFVGEKASPVLANRIASAVGTILAGEQSAGIIVGDANSPAYSGITVIIKGDTAQVSFNCQPAVPVNFVAITVHAGLFSGEITVAVQ